MNGTARELDVILRGPSIGRSGMSSVRAAYFSGLIAGHLIASIEMVISISRSPCQASVARQFPCESMRQGELLGDTAPGPE